MSRAGKHVTLGCFSHGGNSFLGRSAGRFHNGIQSFHNRVGGKGRTGNGIDIRRGDGQGLADELSLEGIIQSLGAETGGLGKALIANGDCGNRTAFIQINSNSHRTGKALSRSGLGILTSGGNGSNFFRRSSNGNSAAQLSLHLVDGVHNGGGGDGSAGDGVNISQSQRGHLADELSLEGLFQSASAIAGRFVEEGVADGDLGDRAGIIQRQGHGYGTGKALHAGGVGRSAFAAHIHHKLTGRVNAAVYSGGGDGSAGNSVDDTILSASGALGKGQRHRFTDELIGKAGFLGPCAQTGGLAEVVAAHVDAGDYVVSVQTNGNHNLAGVAANGGFHNVANAFAVGVKAFIAAVHGAALLKLNLLERGGGRQQTGARFLRSTKCVFCNRTFGDHVENRQQQSCNQAKANQRHQISKELLHNGESSFVFAPGDA